ncbi:O-antigen ligase family protein [Paenibacillus sp. FSL K6-1096]|uniref:O-antigen ligase family protein n=1 Tax=Paenibacillus sp. FSL K6-1096 TaxID=2921460 RepID=UPI0030ECD5D5
MSRSERRRTRLIAIAGGLALFAALLGACALRGFFFAGEMYRFLTLWFAWCGGVALLVSAGQMREWSGKKDVRRAASRAQASGTREGDMRAQGNIERASAETEVAGLSGGERLVTGGGGNGAVFGCADDARTSAMFDGVEEVGRTAVLGGADETGNGARLGGAVEAGSGAKLAGADEVRGKNGRIPGDGGSRGLGRHWTAWVLPGCCLVIFLLYVIHMLGAPISSQGTLNELLRWGFYGSFTVFAVLAAGDRRGLVVLAVLWHLTGLLISLSALLAVCGVLPLPYAVAYTESPGVSATGARLGGLLEYPNALGAVMAVYLLERLFAAAYSFGPAAGRVAAPPWLTAARLSPLFPYAAALLLSESRGAWLAAATAGAAALLPKRHLFVPLLMNGAAPVAAAALLYRQLARAGLAAEPLPGLLALAGLWAGAVLAGLWLYRRCGRAAGRDRAAALALAAACWTAAASAVLLLVRARITGPSPTAAARGLFYRDAWRLAAEAPWLGRGGETWRQAYLSAQSRPYVGSQVHSGYLDTLLNLGVAGLMVILLLLLAAGWLIAKASPRLLPPLLVMILHSAVDFDWSYGLFWLLLLLLPAWALAEKNSRADAPGRLPRTTERSRLTPATPPVPDPSALPYPGFNAAAEGALPAPLDDHASSSASPSGSAVPAKRTAHTRSSIPVQLWNWQHQSRQAALLALCGAAILCSGLSYRAMRGADLFKQAVHESQPAAQAALLQQSLKWNPRQPQAAIALSRLLPEEQGTDLLLRSLKYSPRNAALQWELAADDLRSGHPGEALYWVRRSQQADPFNAARRVSALQGMLDQGKRSLAAGDRATAADSAAAGLELLRQYRLLAAREESKGAQHNDRGFAFLPQADEIYRQLRQLHKQSMLAEPPRFTATTTGQ